MGRPLKIKEASQSLDADSGTFVGGIDVGFNNPAGNYYGVVGGDTDLATNEHPTTTVRVKIGGNSEADGYIIRQKGRKKFLVSDGTNEGVCVVSDLNDSSLTDDTMTITCYDSGSSAIRLEYLTNKWALDFSGNRYLVNFFDISASTIIKSGTNGVTVDLVQVENPIYG
jgi:hypothetical protein